MVFCLGSTSLSHIVDKLVGSISLTPNNVNLSRLEPFSRRLSLCVLPENVGAFWWFGCREELYGWLVCLNGISLIEHRDCHRLQWPRTGLHFDLASSVMDLVSHTNPRDSSLALSLSLSLSLSFALSLSLESKRMHSLCVAERHVSMFIAHFEPMCTLSLFSTHNFNQTKKWLLSLYVRVSSGENQKVTPPGLPPVNHTNAHFFAWCQFRGKSLVRTLTWELLVCLPEILNSACRLGWKISDDLGTKEYKSFFLHHLSP